MDQNSEPEEGDILPLAGTRPPMVPVINIPLIPFIIMTGLVALSATINWNYIPVAIFIDWFMWRTFKEDHNALTVFQKYLMTSFLDTKAHRLGGTSIEVFPSTYRGGFRGIPNAD